MIHPYERIEVDYVPPSRPEHIVEDGIAKNHNGEYRSLFIDGQEVLKDTPHGWGNVIRWKEQTERWRAREAFGDTQMFDAIQIARLRRIKMFGHPQGVASDPPRKFERWLMEHGWRPVMLDLLNAYSPGRCLVGRCAGGNHNNMMAPMMHYTHVYVKEDRSLSMQFGYGPFNFVYMLSDIPGVRQIPVDESLFQAAVALPDIDTPLTDTMPLP